MRKFILGLVNGRHSMPVEEYVFGGEIKDPLNFTEMASIIDDRFQELEIQEGDEVHVYVTGLTAATVEVINACKKHNVTLYLYHFDRDTNDYKKQTVM